MSLRISFLVFLAAPIYLCCGQQASRDSCALHLRNARNSFYTFYQKKDTSMLLTALNEAEDAMTCSRTRRPAIEMKIGILMALKRYTQGTIFVDSVSAEDFRLPYQKMMSFRFFKAMECEATGDTVGRDRNYDEIVSDIAKYVNKEKLPAGKIDERAFGDLFFIKSRFMSEGALNREIDSVHKLYPGNQDFFDALHGTMYENSASSSAIPN